MIKSHQRKMFTYVCWYVCGWMWWQKRLLFNVNGLKDCIERLSNQLTKHNLKLNEILYNSMWSTIEWTMVSELNVLCCALCINLARLRYVLSFVMYFSVEVIVFVNFLVENQMASLSVTRHCLFVEIRAFDQCRCCCCCHFQWVVSVRILFFFSF